MTNKSTRITTLEHMILRDEGRGKSDTFIYTVPKVNKVKAYCKLGKLEDIMEHFKINSIEQLINILEAWEIVKDYIIIGEEKNFLNGFYLTQNEVNTIKKALEVKDNGTTN